MRALAARATGSAAGIASVDCIGDALAPGAIVHAVHSAHRYARELDPTPPAARAAGATRRSPRLA